MKTIAVDFDGVLVKDKWPEIGDPITENIELIKRLKADGHKIILWTCRTGFQLAEAVQYLRNNFDLTFDKVNENLTETIIKYGGDSRKITADIYFDDRNAGYEQLRVLADLGMTEEEFNKAR